MGLDIIAFSRVTKRTTDATPDDRSVELRINPLFAKHATGIEDGATYDYEDRYSFRAGSYSEYNEWRETLAAMAGYESTDDGEDEEEASAVNYIGPNGEVWSGRGLTPRWLSTLVWQGKTKEDFACPISANQHQHKDTKPFSKLIYFSDCAGIINAKTCGQLLRDFIEWDSTAHMKGDSFYPLYRNWTTSLEIAADSGVLVFC